jgi:hypothetical protein
MKECDRGIIHKSNKLRIIYIYIYIYIYIIDSLRATRSMRLEADWGMQRRMRHSCAHG